MMTPSMKAMDVRVLKQKLDKGEIFLLDVRTPGEHLKSHVENDTLLPLDTLDEEAINQLRESVDGQEICTMCVSGRRAALAARKLLDAGFKKVNILQGGIRSWEDAEFPLVRTRRSRTKDRQVRFFIGALVLGGTITSWFTHQAWWLAVPGILGVGLIFSGIIGISGLSKVLRKVFRTH